MAMGGDMEIVECEMEFSDDVKAIMASSQRMFKILR